MLSLSLATVWTGGLPQSGWNAFKRHFQLRMEVYAFQKRILSEELLRLWGATCYIMDQSAFFPFFYAFDYEAFTCMLADLQYKTSWIFFIQVRLLVSLQKISWFRRIVMARSPECIMGNTLLLNVSQDKRYLSRIYQQWPWKKSRPQKKSGKCNFNLSLSVISLKFSLHADLPFTLRGAYETIKYFIWNVDRGVLLTLALNNWPHSVLFCWQRQMQWRRLKELLCTTLTDRETRLDQCYCGTSSPWPTETCIKTLARIHQTQGTAML